MHYGKNFILLLALLPAIFAQTNYCSAKLCSSLRGHIACNNNGQFALTCQNPRLIKITKSWRSQILYRHNVPRNLIAQGFDKFPTAERMGAMVWSNELAKLAEFNVKQCKIDYDECHNTKQFPHTGQNIAISWWKDNYVSVRFVNNYQIYYWFHEYKNCPVDVIKSYENPSKGKDISHFTAMIQDKSTSIGCDIIRFDKNGFTNQLMTCNYSYNNTLSAPVYRQGPTASKCTSGTHKEFTSLCSSREKYD